MQIEFSNLGDEDLLSRLLSLRGKERAVELEILRHLSEVERRGLYLKRGYSSLFMYCTQALGYADGSAYRRIEAMKLVRAIPEVGQSLKEGGLTVSSASQAQVFFSKTTLNLNQPAKRAVLKMLQGQSTRNCEKILAEMDPAMALEVKEKLRPLPGNRMALTVVLSPGLQAKLEKLQSLLSHQVLGQAELIEKLADLALAKLEPESKVADRPLTFARKSSKPHAQTRYIPQSLRREVYRRDQGRCQYQCPTTGRRCLSTRFLQVDHSQKFAEGGEATLQNLRMLCGAHNRAR